MKAGENGRSLPSPILLHTYTTLYCSYPRKDKKRLHSLFVFPRYYQKKRNCLSWYYKKRKNCRPFPPYLLLLLLLGLRVGEEKKKGGGNLVKKKGGGGRKEGK